MSDVIQEAIETLTELKRMHQLNFELLEQLNVTCQWILETGIEIPNKNKMRSLIGKSLSLLSEVQSDMPKTLIYQKLSDKRKHRDDSDTEVTVPFQSLYKGGIVCFSQ